MHFPPERRVWLHGALAGLACLFACSWLPASEPLAAFNKGNWPFCPPERPAIPAVENADWVRNPIDAFILDALEAEGLKPSRPADELTLLRRVTFYLTGMPPTLEEQIAFLAYPRAGAYERLV